MRLLNKMVMFVISLIFLSGCVQGGLAEKNSSSFSPGIRALIEKNKNIHFKIDRLENGFSPVVNNAYVLYPNPQNGEQVIKNHLTRFRGYQIRRDVNSILSIGGENSEESSIEEYLFSYDPNQPIYRRMMHQMTGPPRRKGEIVLMHDYREQNGEKSIWQYLPGTRRVRLAPNLLFDSPYGKSSLKTWDGRDMFSGSMEKFNWELVGEANVYVPKMVVREDFAATDVPTISDLPLLTLKRMLVVETTLKPGYEHKFNKSVYYVDPDTWQILIAEHYENDVMASVVSIAQPEYFESEQAILSYADLTFGLNGDYVIDQYNNYKFTEKDKIVESYFTVSQLRRGGCKR